MKRIPLVHREQEICCLLLDLRENRRRLAYWWRRARSPVNGPQNPRCRRRYAELLTWHHYLLEELHKLPLLTDCDQ